MSTHAGPTGPEPIGLPNGGSGGEESLFNPFDPAFRINPYPFYERLREEQPIYESPFGALVLSRYRECHSLLHNPNSSSDERNSAMRQAFVSAATPEVKEFLEFRDAMTPFLFMDPPDHTRLRGLVSKAFTPRVVDGLRPRIQQLVDQIIDSRLEAGSMDVIEDLAYPLPVRVISEMLGVPPEDHETFKGWSKVLARSLDPEPVIDPIVAKERITVANEFADYFRGLIAKRRDEPTADLLSALIASEEGGDVLTEAELLSTCILLLVAGHETTVNLMGNGVLQLLKHPDQLERLRDDASLAKTCVEEVLRFDPPVQMTARIALEDIELDGKTLPKGRDAVLLLASANRDPDQFDEPDRFDITRTKNPHMAFSNGIHFCLGAPLARVEGQIALATMARRLPSLKLQNETPEYKENIVLRGLATLQVAF